MRRYRTFNSGRHRSLYALAQQPRPRRLKHKDWKPNAQCEAKRSTRCRLCNIEGHTELHHIVPRSLSRLGRDDPDNLIGLCRSCHDAFTAGGPIPRSILTLREQDALERHAPSIGWLARRYPREQRTAA